MDKNELIDKLDRRLTLEMPFVRNDGTMTIGEFMKEWDYYKNHIKEYRNGTYKPLWKHNQAKRGE